MSIRSAPLFICLGLVGCAARTPSSTSRAIIWEEEEGGLVAQYLKMRQAAFGVDGRGIIVERTDAHHTALIDLLALLRQRVTLIAHNLANADVTDDGSLRTETDSGGNRWPRFYPYRRQISSLVNGPWGAPILSVGDDPSDLRSVFDPGHRHSVKNPEASDFGRVYYPNVNSVVEMTELIHATRSYEAVLQVLKSWDSGQ